MIYKEERINLVIKLPYAIIVYFKKILFSAVFLGSIANSLAIEFKVEPRNHSVVLLAAKGSSANIFDIVKQKKLLKPHSYFIGLGYRSKAIFFEPLRMNLEIFKHFGRQQSYELALYATLETPTLYIGNLGSYLAIGEGISALVGPKPKFEHSKYLKGKYKSSEKIKAHRLLNYLIIEQNIFKKDNKQYQLTFRWHHRCNCFGHIAPKNTGANFFGAGLRVEL